MFLEEFWLEKFIIYDFSSLLISPQTRHKFVRAQAENGEFPWVFAVHELWQFGWNWADSIP